PEIDSLGVVMERGHRVPHHHPWPRAIVTTPAWRSAAGLLGKPGSALLGLWGDRAAVHMALLSEPSGEICVISLEGPDGTCPSVPEGLPAAARREAAIRDLFGLRAEGTPEPRPWLDHGRWGVSRPLAVTPGAADARPYRFLPAEGESLHEIPVGPVHAGII